MQARRRASLDEFPGRESGVDARKGQGYANNALKTAKTWIMGVGLAFLIVIAWGLFGGSSNDPRVGGRRLSSWFKELTQDPMVWALGSSHPGGFEVWMALDAFRSQGTNALPFLVNELVRSARESPMAEFLEEMNSRLPLALRRSGVVRRTRVEAVLGTLSELDLQLSDLLPHVQRYIASDDPLVASAAIESLGCLRTDSEAAAMELRRHAGAGTPLEVRAAIKALDRLGPAAIVAVAEVVQAKLDGGISRPELNWVLGSCGPAAEAAVAKLEAEWNVAKDKWRRIDLAITLCRIRPGHSAVWPFLESVARGDERTAPIRIQPVEIARYLRQRRVRDPQFNPLLQGMLARDRRPWTSTESDIVGALNQSDPGGVDRYMRDRIAVLGATDAHVGTVLGALLLRLQPTNEFAKATLIQAATVNDGARPMFAAQALAACAELPDGTREILEALARDPRQAAPVREVLAQRLEWWRLRESLKRKASDEKARAESVGARGGELTR